MYLAFLICKLDATEQVGCSGLLSLQGALQHHPPCCCKVIWKKPNLRREYLYHNYGWKRLLELSLLMGLLNLFSKISTSFFQWVTIFFCEGGSGVVRQRFYPWSVQVGGWSFCCKLSRLCFFWFYLNKKDSLLEAAHTWKNVMRVSQIVLLMKSLGTFGSSNKNQKSPSYCRGYLL